MTELKNPKKRANKLYITFNSPLAPQSMNALAQDMTFTGQFTKIDVIKHNENVIGIHVLDKEKITINLNTAGAEAWSQFQRDSKVKTRLETVTKNVLKKLGRNEREYTLDDSTRHEAIELNLNNLIKDNMMKGLKTVFEKKGYDSPKIHSIRIIATKKGIPEKQIQFHYPTEEDMTSETVVIEANVKLITEIIKLIK